MFNMVHVRTFVEEFSLSDNQLVMQVGVATLDAFVVVVVVACVA
jgi:hypothetical protein